MAVRKWNKRQQAYALFGIVLLLFLLSGVAGREKFAKWFFGEKSFLWTVLLAVLVCALQLISEKRFFLKILSALVMGVLMLCSLFTGRHVPKAGVALILLYVVMTLAEYTRISSREEKKEKSHAYFVWIAPFLALYFCVLCLLPAPGTPYSWQWVKEIYLHVEEKVTICVENFVSRKNVDLDGSVSGFSERAAHRKNIMTLEAVPGKKQPLYLTGKIYDSFDGREWKSTEEGKGRERLFCLEAALADMEYNTNPGGLPKEVTDEQSFLHYFLTENPKGFCSYYATAFVLLARAEGFPARYVQGFCVPLENAEETEVYSDMAHAWPEVYVEGRGWIPFEPTPGYGVSRYPAEEEERKDSVTQTQEPPVRERRTDETDTSDEQEKEKNRRLEELRKAAGYMAAGVLLLLAAGILAFVTDRLWERHREKGRSRDEKYRRAVLRNLQILSMLGYERESSETYHELLERIRVENGGKDIPTAFLEWEECLEQREELIRILREKKGKRYLFYWIRLNV